MTASAGGRAARRCRPRRPRIEQTMSHLARDGRYDTLDDLLRKLSVMGGSNGVATTLALVWGRVGSRTVASAGVRTAPKRRYGDRGRYYIAMSSLRHPRSDTA